MCQVGRSTSDVERPTSWTALTSHCCSLFVVWYSYLTHSQLSTFAALWIYIDNILNTLPITGSKTYSRLDLNHYTKFCANISIGGWLTITFQNSRWRPSAILDFWKPGFWRMSHLRLSIFHHGTKFGAKTSIDAQIMAQKQNSRWRPLPSWIFFGGYFGRTADCWSQPPYKILCQYLNWRLTYCNLSKFKVAAVCHLEFVVWDHPRSLCGKSHQPVKFYVNPMQVLKIWDLNFCRFGLKCLFTSPQFWFLGVKSRKTSVMLVLVLVLKDQNAVLVLVLVLDDAVLVLVA